MNDQPQQTTSTPGTPTPPENSGDTQPPAPSPVQLAELEQLIAELKLKVADLRSSEFDAASLEQRLRELNELAVKAASAVDSAAR
ncbi:MAG: hypothetical protein HZB14_01915 [Actinobacteria bacterium]|nr:hypothetical protein [Actinomycetota bacterium]